MRPRIVAEGLSKRYAIRRSADSYLTLREQVARAAAAPWHAMRALTGAEAWRRPSGRDEVWALREVSFEVAEGEVFGIIGRNGAGKSTLLKVLSRIVAPTSGRARVRGRVGTMLEVGAGFHPELSGRDNIYLSGAILGMTRGEIARKFDEIVAFAGTERFIGTPVKHYSTGMYLRLAFAVAAHLEADILVVDEVLAVGDAEFQKRCLGRMREVAGAGRTVLLVSHNLAVVRSLCHRCGLLEGGRLVRYGDALDCIAHYLDWKAAEGGATVRLEGTSARSPRLTTATLLSDEQPSARNFMGSSLSIEVTFESDDPLHYPILAYGIASEGGDVVVTGNNLYQESPRYAVPVRSGTIRCDLGPVPLMAGRYTVSLYLGDTPGLDTHVVEHALSFEVIERDLWGTGQLPVASESYMWWPTTFRFLPSPTVDQ